MTFFGKTGSNMGPWTDVAHIKSCNPWIYISNELLSTSNGDQMPKLHPWEVETPIYPNGTQVFGASSPRVRFLMFQFFHCFSIIHGPLSLIVTQFRGLQPPHLFLEIHYQHPSYFISIMSVSIFMLFDINEMRCYFRCISVFMVMCLFCCVPA